MLHSSIVLQMLNGLLCVDENDAVTQDGLNSLYHHIEQKNFIYLFYKTLRATGFHAFSTSKNKDF